MIHGGTILDTIAQSLALRVGNELQGRELATWPGMTWGDVRRQIEPGEFVVIPRSAIAHPRDVGALEASGAPRGQSSDWRFPPAPDCTGLHVQAFGELWEAHVDTVHPKCSGVEHLRHDAPQLWVSAGTIGGLLLGVLANRPLVGALAGGAVALVTLPRGKGAKR